jgi:HK97 family phage major capsid protein
MPQTLMGFPLILNQRQPVLGTAGDLMFVDLKKYLIKDGAAMAIGVNPYLYYLNNQTVIRIFWNVDGQPFLKGPILSEDGSTQLSPFIRLDVVAS